MKRLAPLVAMLALAACSYPTTTVSSVDTRPHLSVTGAPAGSVLTIDNISMGDATAYTPDKKLITLDHGTHHVIVTSNGKTLYDNAVYLGNGANSTITIPQ